MTDEKKENELEVLFPDQEIEIGGEKIEVKEIRFMDALKMHDEIQPILEDILRQEGESFNLQSFLAVFSRHTKAMTSLISKCTGKPGKWIEALGDNDGSQLFYTFWAVNKGFFYRRIVVGMALRQGTTEAASERSSPS